MQSRLAIVLMSVAGTAALFAVGFLLGLGVMSTPSPTQHKEIALTTKPTKVTRAETTANGNRDERALTPLYPAAPGGAATAQAAPAGQSEQASAKPTSQPAAEAPAPQPQQTAAAPQAAPAQEPKDLAKNEAKRQQAKDQPKPDTPAAAAAAPAPVQTAKAEPAPAAQPDTADKATPVSLSTRNACDVAACSRAYRSFRESDCTYQPYSGPRQICVSPPGASDASRGSNDRQASRGDEDEPAARVRVHRPGRGVELDNVVREVERITDGRRPIDDERPYARRYHRDFTADGEDDRIDHGGGRGFFFDAEDDDQ